MDYIGLVSIAISVIYLILHTTGDVCPRYPPSSCQGPFTIRPSSGNNPADDRSCSKDHAVMERCLTQCMHAPCCRAFGVLHGYCTMANFHTEAYNFVKEAITWPVSPQKCLAGIGMKCRQFIGGYDGAYFSLKQNFLDAASDLRAIGGELDTNMNLIKLETDYGNGFNGKVLAMGVETFRCDLNASEYITGVTGYLGDISGYTMPFVSGIEFRTTLKICGPYGRVTDITSAHTVHGHMLLYVEGYVGQFFNTLEFTFHKC